MKRAETVTFGTSGLDRAGELRGSPEKLDALLNANSSTVLPLWRGKPLISGAARDQIAWLPSDHTLFEHAKEPTVFLGLDEGIARFARDVSDWEPDELPDTLHAFLDPSEQHPPGTPDDHAFTELRTLLTQFAPREAELLATAKAVLGWHATHKFCAKCGATSDMAMAGWQRDCPTCGAHHFPRTDPVVIMLITHGNSVLMGRSPGWPEGMYSLLAGFVEPGETLEAAVRREVFEESGITVGEVEYLSSQPWPFPASLMFGCWGQATSEEIKIDPVEIEDAKWVSREEMAAVFAGTSDVMKPARKGAIAHFLLLNWLADTLD